MPRTTKLHRSRVARVVERTVPPERGPQSGVATRTIVLWSPDWPITAVIRSTSVAVEAPVALLDRGAVFACSASARAAGVKRGQRVRDAQARCPELVVLPYEAAVDARAFEPVITAIEALTPGVQVLRPGVCAIRARGPARYYGSEKAAALALAGVLDDLGIRGTRVGIADGPFAAQQAAKLDHIVPPGESAAFLAELPVQLLDDPPLVTLLRRLGIGTLGDFAALESIDVRDRFGDGAAWLHALAGGGDSRPVQPRTPTPEFDERIDFEPPLDRIDQVAFGVRTSAESFIARLTAAKLVCTALRIEVDTENEELSERSWLHPRSFTPADVVDRVRWQLQGAGEIDSGLRSRITRVRIVPEGLDPIGDHEHGLWGSGPDERIHSGLSRVQSMLGHGAVLSPVIAGGRMLADRVALVPWGDPPAAAVTRPVERPWPGRLPPPAPATVFAVPHPVSVFAADGSVVAVDDRGQVTAPPATFSAGASTRAVTSWAGPWSIDERWWDADAATRASRFQIVDETGCAWLLVLSHAGSWWLEARYE